MRHTDRDSAQEVVSETFLVAWRRLADVPGDPLPWLLVVARNTVANQRRSGYRRSVLQDEVARLHRAVGPAPGADELVVDRADVLSALARLTAKEREALLLVAWDGLSPADAARVAGCSTSAFHVRLSAPGGASRPAGPQQIRTGQPPSSPPGAPHDHEPPGRSPRHEPAGFA
ncbi:MAG: RNA polymerase sigma factor [Mycobacteriales bacterium]